MLARVTVSLQTSVRYSLIVFPQGFLHIYESGGVGETNSARLITSTIEGV